MRRRSGWPQRGAASAGATLCVGDAVAAPGPHEPASAVGGGLPPGGPTSNASLCRTSGRAAGAVPRRRSPPQGSVDGLANSLHTVAGLGLGCCAPMTPRCCATTAPTVPPVPAARHPSEATGRRPAQVESGPGRALCPCRALIKRIVRETQGIWRLLRRCRRSGNCSLRLASTPMCTSNLPF